MRNVSYSRRGFLVSSLIPAGATLGLADEPRPQVPSYNHISDEDEVKLGRDAANGIEKEKNLKFIEIPEVQEYAERVLKNIARNSRRPNLPYSVKIVDTKEINAFALP